MLKIMRNVCFKTLRPGVSLSLVGGQFFRNALYQLMGHKKQLDCQLVEKKSTRLINKQKAKGMLLCEVKHNIPRIGEK